MTGAVSKRNVSWSFALSSGFGFEVLPLAIYTIQPRVPFCMGSPWNGPDPWRLFGLQRQFVVMWVPREHFRAFFREKLRREPEKERWLRIFRLRAVLVGFQRVAVAIDRGP